MVVQSKVDAALVERWLIKTLINFAFERDMHIADRSAPVGQPPDWLVATCFGRRPLLGHAGMYFASKDGVRLSLSDEMKYWSMTDQPSGGLLLGGAFELHGVKLLLHLLPDEPPVPPSHHIGEKPGWRELDLHRRHPNVTVKAGIWPSQIIDFDWSAAL